MVGDENPRVRRAFFTMVNRWMLFLQERHDYGQLLLQSQSVAVLVLSQCALGLDWLLAKLQRR